MTPIFETEFETEFLNPEFETESWMEFETEFQLEFETEFLNPEFFPDH